MTNSVGQYRTRFFLASAMNEPHLDVVGLACQFAPDQITRRFRRHNFDDRRIAEVELRIGDHRNQRPRDGDTRRFRRSFGGVAHLEIPERAADVDDAGHAAREPNLERGGQARLVTGDFVRIRNRTCEVRDIRSRIEIA